MKIITTNLKRKNNFVLRNNFKGELFFMSNEAWRLSSCLVGKASEKDFPCLVTFFF